MFLVLVILIGFFYEGEEGKMKWIGWATGIAVVVWAIVNWNFWRDNFSISWWVQEYFWSLIILAGVIAVVAVVASSGRSSTPKPKRGG